MSRTHALPIGVFDSGLGGLTVLRSLRSHLPAESFIYLGDVARLPYGSKSQAVIGEYARQCIRFLLDQQVKAVVIACNTASAMALDTLRPEVPVPLFGVVDPGVTAGLASASKGVLVLATESTVRSEAYLKAFAARAPRFRVKQLACPLLVSLAEEGWFDHTVTAQVIAHYLDGVDWNEWDTIVLGCTHFPLLEPSFRRVLPEHVKLVHGGDYLAERVRSTLDGMGLLGGSGNGTLSLLTTDRVSARRPLLVDWLDQTTEPRVVHLGPVNERA